MELNGRVALVTGGSGDLGASICRALALSKVNVAVAYVGERSAPNAVAAEVERPAADRGRSSSISQVPRCRPSRGLNGRAFRAAARRARE